jgi:hypothetical protein
MNGVKVQKGPRSDKALCQRWGTLESNEFSLSGSKERPRTSHADLESTTSLQASGNLTQ